MPREMIPEDEIERWVTVHGVRVPIRKGQSEKDVTDNVEKEMGMEPTYEDSYDYNDFIEKNLKKLKEVYEKHKHDDDDIDYIKEEWYKTRLAEEKKDIHEIPIEDAIKTVREAIPDRIIEGWFRRADSEYKPHIMDGVMANKGVLNAGLNIAYYNYRYQFERYSEVMQKWIPHEWADQSKKLSFEAWVQTPQEMWRGDRGQEEIASDVFRSYSANKKIAAGFVFNSAGGHKVSDAELAGIDPKRLTSIKLRPIDTLGSYQTTGEEEFLVPKSKLRKH